MLQNMSMTDAFCENEIIVFFFLLSRSNGTGSIAGLVVRQSIPGWVGLCLYYDFNVEH